LSKPNPSFQKKLNSIVKQMSPQHRERTSKEIQQVLNSGVTSFRGLLQCVNDDTKPLEVRTTACWLLPRLKTTKCEKQQIADTLLLVLNHENEALRLQAIIGLGDLNTVSQDVIQQLEALIHSDLDIETRKAAIYSYGNVVEKNEADALFPIITKQDEAPGIRGMAIEAIAKIGDNSAILVLIELLSDPFDEVRFWSAFSLGSLGAIEAVPELKRLVETDHKIVPGWHSVSQEAADAIGNIQRYSQHQI
jgi:hypothetical protein